MIQSLHGRLLFVYGSLRRGFALHHHLARLHARFFSDAKTAGELFDLGRHPGARWSGRDGNWVHGELFQLPQPTRNLRVLDKIEGFIPSAPERCPFVRGPTEVILSNGERHEAWIYWLGERVTPARRIASGDYSRWRGRGKAAVTNS